MEIMKANHAKTISLAMLMTVCAGVIAAESMRSPSPDDAEAYIISPQDGATVPRKFTVVFGLKGMGVAPAGVDKANTGHHHLLINVDDMPDMAQPLPSTDQVRHFGGGQTQADLELAPGQYTLQLVLGNHAHVPHDKPVISEKITVFVE